MKTVFDLPLELREAIYSHVFDEELTAPALVEEYNAQYHKELGYYKNANAHSIWGAHPKYGHKGYRQVYLQRDPFAQCEYPTYRNLLATHSRINHEIRATRARKAGHAQLNYKLDCLIYHDYKVYLTWLRLPAPAARIDTVHIDFRVLGPPSHMDHTAGIVAGMGYLLGPDSSEARFPRFTTHILWELLGRLFTRGPVLDGPDPGGHDGHQNSNPNACAHQGLHAQELVLNVYPPPSETGAFAVAHPYRSRWETLTTSFMMSLQPGLQVRGGQGDALTALLREHIEVLTITYDGRLSYRVNYTDLFKASE